jgi:hypothetical protein
MHAANSEEQTMLNDDCSNLDTSMNRESVNLVLDYQAGVVCENPCSPPMRLVFAPLAIACTKVTLGRRPSEFSIRLRNLSPWVEIT